MLTKEELKYLEDEMNITIECVMEMLVKGDSKVLRDELEIAESILEKVRKM